MCTDQGGNDVYRESSFKFISITFAYNIMSHCNMRWSHYLYPDVQMTGEDPFAGT